MQQTGKQQPSSKDSVPGDVHMTQGKANEKIIALVLIEGSLGFDFGRVQN